MQIKESMNEMIFWSIIDQSRKGLSISGSDENFYKQYSQLEFLLKELSEDDLIDFDIHFSKLTINLYNWDIWGVAYIISQGCSDDCFMDFRDWVVSMGKDVYEKVVKTPESLVDILDDPTINYYLYEGFCNIASKVHGKPIDTGLDYPLEPSGEKWATEEALSKRFPKIWEKFKGGWVNINFR